MTEDEIFGWHHQSKGHEFEQALGVGKGKEILPLLTTWMDPEDIMLNEVTQSQNKHCLTPLIRGTQSSETHRCG